MQASKLKSVTRVTARKAAKATRALSYLRVQRALLEPRLRRRKVGCEMAIHRRLEALARHVKTLAQSHGADDAALRGGTLGLLADKN